MGIKEDVKASYSAALGKRMRNWARSVAGSSEGFAQVNWDFEPRSTDDDVPVPIMAGEAEDTGKALATLPMRFRRAVELYWVWGDEDAELSVLGRKCAVDYRTFGARVIEGHALLKAELARAAEAWRQHRERSEAAVSLARPMGGVLT